MDDIVTLGIATIDSLNDNFHDILTQDMELALTQCNKARDAAKELNYQKGILDANFNQAWYHLWKCEFNLAFPLLKNLPEQYNILNDEVGYLKAINALGAIHLDMGNYESALPYFLKSLKRARKKNNREREASALANLGLLYEGLDNIEEAYSFFSSALDIPELNSTGFYTASKCITLYYIDKADWTNAKHYLDSALKRSRENLDIYFESELLVTQGKLHLAQQNLKAAQHCFMMGFDISKQLGSKKIETEHLYELGCLALMNENIELALTYFDQVKMLAQTHDIGRFICHAYQKLSFVYEQKQDYKHALEYLKSYNAMAKKYDLMETELKLKSLGFEHELEQKQKLAEIYRLKNIELEKANQKVLQLANHDSLTGLPNRRLLMEQLKITTAIAESNGSKIAILFIDLDNFKPVNDQFGHRTGDLLLQQVSNRIKQQLEESAVVARFGGDEFVIIIPNITDIASIKSRAKNITRFMYQPYSIADQHYQLGSSIGISIFPEHGRDIEDLLSKADQAMYDAKINGKNRYLIYQEENR